MTDTSMRELRELREKALRATPCGWLLGPYGCVWPASDIEFRDGKWRELVEAPKIIHSPSAGGNPEDAAYIAAADPQTVIALLDRIEAVEAALKPFAQLADELPLSKPSDRTAWGYNDKELTYGHFRAARAALSGKEGQS